MLIGGENIQQSNVAVDISFAGAMGIFRRTIRFQKNHNDVIRVFSIHSNVVFLCMCVRDFSPLFTDRCFSHFPTIRETHVPLHHLAVMGAAPRAVRLIMTGFGRPLNGYRND